MHTLFQYFNIIALSLCFFGLIIVFAKGKRKSPIFYLFVSNAILILSSIVYWLFTTKAILQHPHFIRVPGPFYYLLGPSMYLFVRSMLNREAYFIKKDWLHAIPFLLSVIELIPFYFSGAENKLAILQNSNVDFDTHIANFNEGVIPKELNYILKAGSWCIYFIISVKIYYTYRKKIKSDIITDYKRKFAFIRFFLWTRLIGFILLNLTTLLVHNNQFYTIFLLASNFISIINIFLLAFEYPEMVYNSSLEPASENTFIYYFEQSLQGKTVTLEEKFMLFDNSDFIWFLMSFTAHHAKNGELIGVSISATEIDAKKKMEELQTKYLQSLDELAWKSSHTLRAPVANMMGILQLLNEPSVDLEEDETKMFLAHLSKEVHVLDTVIKEMVSNARNEIDS